MKKIFIVLHWYYDGDSYLTNSFIGVRTDYEDAKSLLNYNDIIMKKEDFIAEGMPLGWGEYGSVSKYEIREIILED